MYVAHKFYWGEKTRESKFKEVKVAKIEEARAEKALTCDFEASSIHKDVIS